MSRLPLVSPLERALFLKAQPYLDGLNSSVLTALASYTEESYFSAGETIRSASAPINEILFLGRGEVEVLPGAEAGTRRRAEDARIEAPGAIGLAHYFAGVRRPPAVRAASDTLCLQVGTRDLDQIMEDHFALFLQLAVTTGEQLVLSQQALGAGRRDECGFREVDRRETPVQIDLVQLLARMRRAPFFRGTNLNVLAELIRRQEPEVLETGELLWEAGDEPDRLVFILDGRLRSEGEFGSIGAASGATLGGWDCMGTDPHFESWRAETVCRLLPMPRSLFADLLEDHFDFAMAFLGQLSSKLVETWDDIAIESQSAPD